MTESLLIGVQTFVLLVLARTFAPSPISALGSVRCALKVLVGYLPLQFLVWTSQGKSFQVGELVLLSMELAIVATAIGAGVKELLRRCGSRD